MTAKAGYDGQMMDNRIFERAMAIIDGENAKDPTVLHVGAVEGPRELVMSRLVSAWIKRLQADPSPELLLAARGTHLRRWEHPRAVYPAGRGGYLRWRTALYGIHAAEVTRLLEEAGADVLAITRVAELVAKRVPRTDRESQTLEDALCLAFVEADLAALAGRTEDATMTRVLQKTWAKMSEAAHGYALELITDEEQRGLVRRALASQHRWESSE